MAALHKRVEELRGIPRAQRQEQRHGRDESSPDQPAHRPRISSGLSQTRNVEDDKESQQGDETSDNDAGMGAKVDSQASAENETQPRCSPERPPMVIDRSIWQGHRGVADPFDPFPGNVNMAPRSVPPSEVVEARASLRPVTHTGPPHDRRRIDPRRVEFATPALREFAAAHWARRPEANPRAAAPLATLAPAERGAWAFDVATWPAGERGRFWDALDEFARGGALGWDVEVQRDDGDGGGGGTRYRVASSRALAEPLWRLLVAASRGWVQTVRAVWADGDGRQTKLMLPRRNPHTIMEEIARSYLTMFGGSG